MAFAAASAIVGRALSIPKKYPFGFGVVFSGAKTSFADALIQKVVEEKEELDLRRNAAFAVFGFVYLGGIQYALYVPIFKRLFPYAETWLAKPIRARLQDARGMRTMVGQVVLDQGVHHPILYFPAFYATKLLVNGGTLSQAADQYRTNFSSDLLALWKLWVPATIINFTLSPFWLRIPFVASTSLVWTCILSAMRGAMEADPIEEDQDDGFLLLNQGRALGQAFRLFRHDSHNNIRVVVSALGSSSDVTFLHRISEIVHDYGGNCYESKMIKLGGEVAYIAIVGVDKDHFHDLRETLLLSGLHISVHIPDADRADAVQADPDVALDVEAPPSEVVVVDPAQIDSFALATPVPVKTVTMYSAVFTFSGPDKPGIVRNVARFFARNNLVVADMDTEHSVDADGNNVFSIFSLVRIPADSAAETQDDLQTLRSEFPNCAIRLRVKRPSS